MRLGMLLGPALLLGSAAAAADDPVAKLPEGPGREETFYSCSACHDFALVAQQRLSRERWDHLLDWMTAEQNMPMLEGAERALILDYLASNFGPVPEEGKTRRRR